MSDRFLPKHILTLYRDLVKRHEDSLHASLRQDGAKAPGTNGNSSANKSKSTNAAIEDDKVGAGASTGNGMSEERRNASRPTPRKRRKTNDKSTETTNLSASSVYDRANHPFDGDMMDQSMNKDRTGSINQPLSTGHDSLVDGSYFFDDSTLNQPDLHAFDLQSDIIPNINASNFGDTQPSAVRAQQQHLSDIAKHTDLSTIASQAAPTAGSNAGHIPDGSHNSFDLFQSFGFLPENAFMPNFDFGLIDVDQHSEVSPGGTSSTLNHQQEHNNAILSQIADYEHFPTDTLLKDGLEETHDPAPTALFEKLPTVQRERSINSYTIDLDETAYQSILKDVTGRLKAPAVLQYMPTAKEMRKFINSYVESFHRHLPIIHLSTFSASDVPSPLTLAMCGIGALYRLDRRRATRCFWLAEHALNAEGSHGLREPLSNSVPHKHSIVMDDTDNKTALGPLWAAQTRALLSYYSIFSGDKNVVSSALSNIGRLSLVSEALSVPPTCSNMLIRPHLGLPLSPSESAEECKVYVTTKLGAMGIERVQQTSSLRSVHHQQPGPSHVQCQPRLRHNRRSRDRNARRRASLGRHNKRQLERNATLENKAQHPKHQTSHDRPHKRHDRRSTLGPPLPDPFFRRSDDNARRQHPRLAHHPLLPIVQSNK